MKRKILPFLLFLAFAVLLACPVSAAGGNRVTDGAGLLTQAQCDELNRRAAEISQKYRCDVDIVTVNEMDGGDAYEAAESAYRENGLGYGSEKSGLLLFLSMEDRDYALVAYGYGNTAFTDHGKDVMLDDNVLPLLRKDRYYEAFSRYLDLSGEYLETARAGKPFDVGSDPKRKTGAVAAAVLVPFGIALAVCLILKRQMKTAVLQRTADRYIDRDSMHVTRAQDVFLYQTVTRIRIPEESSRGGGTTINRGGFSGRSGKF